MNLYVCLYVYVPMYKMYIYIYVYVYVDVYVYGYVSLPLSMHMYMYVHIHIHTGLLKPAQPPDYAYLKFTEEEEALYIAEGATPLEQEAPRYRQGTGRGALDSLWDQWA